MVMKIFLQNRNIKPENDIFHYVSSFSVYNIAKKLL